MKKIKPVKDPNAAEVREEAEFNELLDSMTRLKKVINPKKEIDPDFPNAKIIVAKCIKLHQLYGMRMEEVAVDEWSINWAFPLSAQAAKSEKYSDTSIIGKFELSEKFPGCPHCEAETFFKCRFCKKLTCCADDAPSGVCAHCKKSSVFFGRLHELDTGDDR